MQHAVTTTLARARRVLLTAPSELDAAGDGFGCTASGGSRFPRALT